MQQLLNGLFTGSVYALFAIGFTLVFGILDRLNLAHPSVFAASAFVGIALADNLDLGIWTVLLLVFIIAAAMGYIVERIAFRPLKNRPDAHFAGLISSIALGGVIIAVLQAFFGTATRRFDEGVAPSGRVEFLGASATYLQLIILVVSIGLVVVLSLLVTKSSLGRSMRAVAENPTAARVMGINVDRVTSLTFAISSALGGVAGVFFALNVNSAQLEMGAAIELKGLAVIIVGGMGSLPGALIAGLLLGVAEAFAIEYVGSSWRDMIAFALLFIILLVMPQGLFGKKKVREV